VQPSYDLLFLHERGFVRARATGQSITTIYGEAESLINKPLTVLIKPGTYFVARGNYQNMVTRCEYTLTLYPCTTQNVAIDATCINVLMRTARSPARTIVSTAYAACRMSSHASSTPLGAPIR